MEHKYVSTYIGKSYSAEEDPRYVAAVEFEYLTERFDRSHDGYFNKHGEYIPYRLGPSVEYSGQVISQLYKKYELRFSEFKYYLGRKSFEWLEQEYKRLQALRSEPRIKYEGKL